jgi:hypothetical protein
MKESTLSNEFGNHPSQIRIGRPSRLWIISEFCGLLQETRSSFLYDRNLEWLIDIHIYEFRLNFLSFEAFESEKGDDRSLFHLALVVRVRFPKMKRHIMGRRIDRYL